MDDHLIDSFHLTGKATLITGGNGGIGLGMAEGLARAGAAVAIAGRDADKNAAAVATLTTPGARAISISADLTKEESCRAMVEEAASELGRLDILVNNAGIASCSSRARSPAHGRRTTSR